jgi:arginine/lysine/ornithine decarboxylase
MKKYGYFGYDFAKILNEKGIVCEFCDPDFVVLMLTPEIKDLDKVKEILLSIEKREPINLSAPKFKCLKIAASVREAVLSPSEALDVDKCLGRVVAMASVGCPPAVPVAVPGEIVDENALDCLKYYNINKINVLK